MHLYVWNSFQGFDTVTKNCRSGVINRRSAFVFFFLYYFGTSFCRRTAVNGTRASNKTERLFPHMHLHCGSIHIFCSSLIVNYEAYFIDIRPNFLLSIIVTLRYRKYEYIITSYFSHVFDNYHSSVLPKNIWFLRNKNTVNLI